MSPREAFQTDPMQRMAISTAYEALEMSGYIPNRTRSTKLDRIGTFYGQTSDDWREINIAQDVDTYFITGGVRAFGPVCDIFPVSLKLFNNILILVNNRGGLTTTLASLGLPSTSIRHALLVLRLFNLHVLRCMQRTVIPPLSVVSAA